MDGSAELVKLAELLRLGAQTGRQIARLRPQDMTTIERLAQQAEIMAGELEALVTPPGAPPKAADPKH